MTTAMGYVIGRVDELADGQMKQVEINHRRIVLARVKGQYYAVGGTCPHYGAPLAEGVLCGGRLLCPWHQSIFDVTTGDVLEPPTLDALPHFPLEIRGRDIFIHLPDPIPERRTPTLAGLDTAADERTVVILGAGAAGYAAAQRLRELAFRGRIVLLSPEDRPPYDRPNCSKDYLAGTAPVDYLPLRPAEFYAQYGIERPQRTVAEVDPALHRVVFSDGSDLRYTCLLLASGSIPRRLNLQGGELANVFTLRTWDDAEAIIAAAGRADRAVLIGSSFISMECAASLAHRGVEVTIVTPEAVPFEHKLGPQIGRMFQTLHEAHGVHFLLGHKVDHLEGPGAVETVVVDDMTRLPARLVIAGIGVRPATDFLRNCPNLWLYDDDSIKVDAYLQASHDIFAAGDIATFPNPFNDRPARIEHWRLAEQHGRIAAANMLVPKSERCEVVPFFWTTQFDVTVNYVGYGEKWDEIVLDGDPAGHDFSAFYITGEEVSAMAEANRSRQSCAFAELLRLRTPPTAARVRQGALDLTALLPHSEGRGGERGGGVGSGGDAGHGGFDG